MYQRMCCGLLYATKGCYANLADRCTGLMTVEEKAKELICTKEPFCGLLYATKGCYACHRRAPVKESRNSSIERQELIKVNTYAACSLNPFETCKKKFFLNNHFRFVVQM